MKKIMPFILVLYMLNAALASERTSAIFFADVTEQLDELVEEAQTLKDNAEKLHKIDKSIRTTKKGQTVYVQFKKVAGTVLLIGLVVGSYKAYFPPGFRAMVSAYVTVTGLSYGMVKLNEKDLKDLLDEIVKLNDRIKAHQKQLEKKRQYYCQQDGRHASCY